MKDQLIDEVFLIYAYTSPLSVQSRLLNEKPYNTAGWQYFEQSEHSRTDLFKTGLGLFLEEVELRRETPIDFGELEKLQDQLAVKKVFVMRDFLIQCLESWQFKDPVRIEYLLKEHGLPSVIPALQKVFNATNSILSAIKFSLQGSIDVNISVPDAELNPVWSRIILPALNKKLAVTGQCAGLPENILQQAQLYLDTAKPFLLFKFDPTLVRPDIPYSFGDLSFVQKWAKKLATKLIASSMLLAGRSESLVTLPSSVVNLEVKDAAKVTNFQAYEPISPEFTNNVEFMSGVRTALQLSSIKDKIEPFWIFKQLPSDGHFTAEHAGFIFGIGLFGGLVSFKSFDAYELLTAGNEDISSAVLLGLALSNIGKGADSGFVPQMLSIHVPGYLPSGEGSNPQLAQVALSTQISALLSLGFVFKGTGNRGISSLLMRELDRRGPVSLKSRVQYSPAYTVAAGMAFGLVNMDLESSSFEEEAIDSFIEMLNSTDDHRVPSAFFALLLLFTGTQDSYVTSKMANVDVNCFKTKPLFIFLRTLLHALILGTFPLDLNSIVRLLNHSLGKESDTFDLDTRIANLCHVVAAYALFLGLCCAGTGDEKAAEQLMKLYLMLGKRHSDNVFHLNYAAKYRGRNVAFLKDILLLAMSLVYSGTGDKEVFSLLRAHFMSILDEHPSRAYIHHLALGFLILGEGKSAMSTDCGKDSAAVTYIMASVYAALNYPFLEDFYFSPIHFQFLWRAAMAMKSPNRNDEVNLGQSPEDLFLSVFRPSKTDYLRAMTGNAVLWKSMTPEDLSYLRKLNDVSNGRLFLSEMLTILYCQKCE